MQAMPKRPGGADRTVPASTFPTSQSSTLADAALPRRARHALERLLVDVRAEMGQQLPQLLQDTELMLARTAPGGDAKLEAARYASMRSLGGGTATVTRRFMAQIEGSLAQLQTTRRKHADPGDMPPVLTLSLLDEEAVSDQSVLDTMASRIESRNSLGLQLLGQRFGVLAGAPAFDGESLPLGPQALCNALADAIEALELSRYARMQLFQQFEKAMSTFYPAMVDALNARLAQDGILPHLSFVPVRVRPGSVAPAAARAAKEAEDQQAQGGGQGGGNASGGGAPGAGSTAAGGRGGQPSGPGEVSPRGWAPGAAQAPAKPANAGFALLQNLLKRRRVLLAKLKPGGIDERVREPLRRDEVLDALQRMRNTATKADTLADYRQILLAQARQMHGHGVALADADSDSFDLLTLFTTQLQRDLRKSSPGEALVERLRLPLAQLALRDHRFFTDAAHPARQILSAVSVAGAPWLADDDMDSQWLGLLQRAVSSVQQDSDGAFDTFVEANQTLQSGLQALARKAEMTERRQVEAARGREKLALARQRAHAEIQRLLHGRDLPRFHTILMEQAWADVLSLVHLRSGEQSGDWQQLLDVTERIIDASTAEAPAAADPDFIDQVRAALEQVGYHAEDANAIARQLANGRGETDDLASRTELLVQLRARARLGEGNAAAPSAGGSTHAAPGPDVQAAHEQLRALQRQAWIELDEDEHPVRRRLAWVSAGSGQALVVNRRGLRVGNDDLDALARKLAAGRMRLLEADPTPAESAWDTTMNSLQRIAMSEGPLDGELGHGD